MKKLIVALLTAAAVSPAFASDGLAVSGKFVYLPDLMWGDQICFSPDARGQQTVIDAYKTSDRQDWNVVWFCFDDTQAAAKLLGVSLKLASGACGFEGQASVTIANYRLYLEENDLGNDVARLVSVQRKSEAKMLTQCDDAEY